MPAQNQSSKLGSSPSPIANRVLQSTKNNQQPVSGIKRPQPISK